MWKVYDMVALKGTGYTVPILSSVPEGNFFPSFLLGGTAGMEFLVSAAGLDQPAAGRGIVTPGVLHPVGEVPKKNLTDERESDALFWFWTSKSF